MKDSTNIQLTFFTQKSYTLLALMPLNLTSHNVSVPMTVGIKYEWNISLDNDQWVENLTKYKHTKRIYLQLIFYKE